VNANLGLGPRYGYFCKGKILFWVLTYFRVRGLHEFEETRVLGWS